METSEYIYRYEIPLDTTGDVDGPLYDASGSGKVLRKKYASDRLILVQTEASPHFHKDSVNVCFEKVTNSEYTDER
jgi:hypothetical protein